MRVISGLITVVGFAFLGLSQQTSAAVLYSNGPVNGTIGAWQISVAVVGYAVSDSFTLSAPSTLTGVNFGAWSELYSSNEQPCPPCMITSVDWGIATVAGTYPDDGTASVTIGPALSPFTSYGSSGGYEVNADSFSLPNISLAAGTYYLILQNAQPDTYEFFWDQDNGPSTATLNSAAGSVGSESFQILGTTTTPLPSTWVMMLSGLLALSLFAYRRGKGGLAAA
jgi:hypothetical protein